MPHTNTPSNERGLFRGLGKVAEAYPINFKTHQKSSIGHVDGKELGHGSAITAIASAQIAAIMRDRTLNAAEKQQGTRALLASQKPPLSPMSSEDPGIVEPALADAHAAWLLGKPLLTVDSCGLAMWPQSKKITRDKSSVAGKPAQRDGKLEPAPSPWTSDSDSENSSGSDASDCASKYPKGAASLFFYRSTSSESESKASTRSASSENCATSMHMSLQKLQATSQGMIWAPNQNAESFCKLEDNTDMTLLKKVLMLEAKKESLQLQIEILRADSKAQEAQNKAELAQVKAQAKSEIEQVRANAQAESENDSSVLMKIVKKLKTDREAQKVQNDSKIEQVKANAAAESKKVSSSLMKIVEMLRVDSKAQKAKNKAKLVHVKAQFSVEIEQVKDNAASELEKFLEVSSHEDSIKIVEKLEKDSDAQHAINSGRRWVSLEASVIKDAHDLGNTLQRLEWRKFKESMRERIKLRTQGGCPSSFPTAVSVVDQWIFTQP